MEDNKNIESSLENVQEEGSSFDIRTIFTLLVLNWQWFLVSMFIFVCGALIYLRYKAPVYQVSAKMLIKEENNNRRPSTQMLANMQDLGFISNSAGIDNEMEILKSRVLALEAVKDLKLYTEYRSEGRITKVLVYKTNPIIVDMVAEDLEDLDLWRGSISMKLTQEGNTYNVKGVNCEFEGSFSTLPATVETPFGILTFTKNEAIPQIKHLSALQGDGGQESAEQKGINYFIFSFV